MRSKSVVAPFTGAWIETSSAMAHDTSAPVAPFTGAWIETVNMADVPEGGGSRPSRARGLKRVWQENAEQQRGRALHGRVD